MASLPASVAGAALLLLLSAPFAQAGEANSERAYTFFSGDRTPLLDPPVAVTLVRAAGAPNYGYTPLSFSLENHTAQPHQVELSYQPREGHPITRTAELGPGERRHVLLPVPVAAHTGELRVEVPSTGAVGHERLYIADPPSRTILFEGTPQQFQTAVGAPPDSGYDNITVSTLTAAELPEEPAALYGYDAVAVSSRLFELRDAQRRALEAYAATGGRLVLLDARGLMAEHLPLLPSRNDGQYTYGFGRVRLCRGARPCTSTVLDDALAARPVLNPLALFVHRNRFNRYSGVNNRYDIPFAGELLLPQAQAPVGRFLLVLVAFTLAVGPGSVYVARRRGPTALLFTIPATALVTCLVIVAYSMLVDGLATHTRTLSVTLLDGRRHRAVTVGVAAFYANLSPGSARFGTTAVLQAPLGRGTGLASVDWTQGAAFGTDMVPSRTYREWGIAAVEPARARLVVKQEGDGVRVQNALGAALRGARFMLGGKRWTVGHVPDGGEARATPDGAAPPFEEEVRDFASRFDAPALDPFVIGPDEGHFVARLEGPGFLPLGGLAVRDHDSLALVYGEVE